MISVTDGTETVSLPAFSIEVDAAPVNNVPPVISGTPAGSETANDGYSFQPAASDADGDPLPFTISNQPGWASFSPSSGHLSGIPADNDVMTYSGIVISVTDGTETVSLPAFSITVNGTELQTGTFTVSWTAPVARADGSPISLADISGYRIYYGQSSGSYPNSMDVADGTAVTRTVTDLLAGIYYIVMTTYDVDGRESVNSAEVEKVVH